MRALSGGRTPFSRLYLTHVNTCVALASSASKGARPYI